MEKNIKLLSNNIEIDGKLFSERTDRRCVLKLFYSDQEIVREQFDFFNCMREIRLELEKTRIQLLCNGAAKNVRPSGMSVDMGFGVKANKLELGKHSNMKNLVNIFDYDPQFEYVSVKVQEEYYKKWRLSIT